MGLIVLGKQHVLGIQTKGEDDTPVKWNGKCSDGNILTGVTSSSFIFWLRYKDVTEEEIFDQVLKNNSFPDKEKKIFQNKRSCIDKAGRSQAAGPLRNHKWVSTTDKWIPPISSAV